MFPLSVHGLVLSIEPPRKGGNAALQPLGRLVGRLVEAAEETQEARPGTMKIYFKCSRGSLAIVLGNFARSFFSEAEENRPVGANPQARVAELEATKAEGEQALAALKVPRSVYFLSLRWSCTFPLRCLS